MKTQNLIPNTPEWHAHRAQHFNASDAPAMMGCSPHQTRSQLLYKLHTGLTADVDAATQRAFDNGHRFEALARPLAEEIIGDDLAPVIGTAGELSASFDGLTLMGDVAWEHKTFNDDLRRTFASIDSIAPEYRDHVGGSELPLHYRVQMEQQLLVADALKCLFMASKWDGDTLMEERHCWYTSDKELRAQIIAGWHQFAADLATYKPEPATVEVIGHTPKTLPALRIEVTGMVTASNLEMFREHALTVFGGINRTLVTDQDFATAKTTVKWCGEVETRLAAAKQHALSQTESIDALFRTIDTISEEARKVRLELDKLVTRREMEVKTEMVGKARAAYVAHEAVLQAETGAWLPVPAPDFAGAIKGKRSLALMQDALDTALANAKIAADASARKIRANLACIETDGAGFEFLFSDRPALIAQPMEHLQLLVQSRIAKHKEAEAAKEEATRARIRAEEQARAHREAAESQAKAITDAQAAVDASRIQHNASGQPSSALTPQPVSFTDVVALMPPVVRNAMTPVASPTLTVGAISMRLGFMVSSSFLGQLGFDATAVKASKLYYEHDFPNICNALVQHINSVCETA